jgi:7-cyano-7-deazaguanine synthase in queuosine biosynthesis
MIRPRLFLCSGLTLPADDPLRDGRHPVELSTQGEDANVHIRLMDLARIFVRHLSPRLEDALEIAAYVYAADCATERGGAWADDDTTEPWRRDLRFIIPVRDLVLWDRTEVKSLLAQVLRFLSDDTFGFEFRQDTRVNPRQEYLEFGKNEDWPFHGVDRVLLFSGGLDSLAGAAETANAGGNLVLVSHRPVSTQSRRQTELFDRVKATWRVPMIHVPVWINKDEKFGKEPTQRTRSFLYATLGAMVATSVSARGVRFFENGVVSLNLPVADEVIGARASRTTHPYALSLLARLFGLILGENLEVDNPYLFKTKKEVVETLAANGGSDLIGYSCSCAHQGIFQPRTRWHCGTCSQCIDRKIAIVAAGLEEHEAAEDYVCDVFTGRRERVEERNMAVNYARHGMELSRMGVEEMAVKFNHHITRAVRGMSQQAQAAKDFVAMHRRHGETVMSVLQQQVAAHARKLVDGSLERTSLLGLVAAGLHEVSEWKRFVERIVSLLRAGLPAACKTHKPKNEPHLQEICDGIIRGQEADLVREFPFMLWGPVSTKPDWSSEDLRLWVELKYVRNRSDIRQISEDIAADITKYGDNRRRVLFVVYDPKHLVIDEKGFAAPVVARDDMYLHVIR